MNAFIQVLGQIDIAISWQAALLFALGVHAFAEFIEELKVAKGYHARGWHIVTSVSLGYGIWVSNYLAYCGLQIVVPPSYATAALASAPIAIGSVYLSLSVTQGRALRWKILVGGAIVGAAMTIMNLMNFLAAGIPHTDWNTDFIALAALSGMIAGGCARGLPTLNKDWRIRFGLICGSTLASQGAFLFTAAGGLSASVSHVTPMPTTINARLGDITMATALALLLGAINTAYLVRKRREAVTARQLADSRGHLVRAQELTGSGSIEIDYTTGAVTWSAGAERLFGFREYDRPGKIEDFIARIHPDDTADARRKGVANPDQDLQIPFEFRVRHKDGTIRLLRNESIVTRDEHSAPTEKFVIIRDVTDMREAEDRQRNLERSLIHAQRIEALGTMAGGIAHELNTPIQFVTDNTTFLASSFKDLSGAIEAYRAISKEEINVTISEKFDLEFLSTEIPQSIDQSLEGLKRIADIVLAIKRFSHPAGGTMEDNNLNEIVNTTVMVSRNQWKYVADMNLDLDPNLPLVPSNAGELNQVLLNLIINAAHAIEDRGETTKGAITIRTRTRGENVECAISDTGVGIKPELRDKIFDLFFTTKAVGRGTGQGLSLVHTIVKKTHQGDIRVESTPGVGTTFVLSFPLHPRASDAVISEAA